MARFEVAIAGDTSDMRRASRCLLENLPGSPGFERRGGSPDAVWGDTAPITIRLVLDEPNLSGDGPGCTPSERFRGDSWVASVSSSLPSVADFEIGEDFEMRVPVLATNPYDSSSTVSLELVIIGRVTG